MPLSSFEGAKRGLTWVIKGFTFGFVRTGNNQLYHAECYISHGVHNGLSVSMQVVASWLTYVKVCERGRGGAPAKAGLRLEGGGLDESQALGGSTIALLALSPLQQLRNNALQQLRANTPP